MKRFIRETIPTLLVIAGAAALTAAGWMIGVPLGLLVGGLSAIAFGVLLIRGGGETK